MFIGTKLLGYSTAGLAIALALSSTWGLRVDHLRSVYKGRWQAVAKEYALFRHEITVRIRDVRVAQEADKSRIEKERKRDADQADARYTGLSERFRSARLRLDRKGGTDPARSRNLPKGGGPVVSQEAAAGGQGADTVTISAAEFDDLAAATAYAVQAHEWAKTLEPAP